MCVSAKNDKIVFGVIEMLWKRNKHAHLICVFIKRFVRVWLSAIPNCFGEWLIDWIEQIDLGGACTQRKTQTKSEARQGENCDADVAVLIETHFN